MRCRMKGLVLALAVGLAVLFTASEGRGGFIKGQELYNDCSADDGSFSVGSCFGYIIGVVDAGKGVGRRIEWQGGWSACIPKGVTGDQMVEVVKKSLRAHPEDWHYEANGLVARALDEAFPCP
ncbi:MAG: Rap1a/Tai family immunity protein [Rhodospirillales bacterium]|nr:Rap1a/Tai family immunity protein [Rhodospirillales bacterium]